MQRKVGNKRGFVHKPKHVKIKITACFHDELYRRTCLIKWEDLNLEIILGWFSFTPHPSFPRRPPPNTPLCRSVLSLPSCPQRTSGDNKVVQRGNFLSLPPLLLLPSPFLIPQNSCPKACYYLVLIDAAPGRQKSAIDNCKELYGSYCIDRRVLYSPGAWR